MGISNTQSSLQGLNNLCVGLNICVSSNSGPVAGDIIGPTNLTNIVMEKHLSTQTTKDKNY